MDDETLDWIATDKSIDPVSGLPFTAVVFMFQYGLELKHFLLNLSDHLVEKYPLKVYDVGRSSVYLCGSTAHGFYLNTNSFFHVKDFDIVSICKKYTIRKACHYDDDTMEKIQYQSENQNQEERPTCDTTCISNNTCISDIPYLNVEKWHDTYPGYVMLRKCRRHQGIAQTMSDRYVSSSKVMESRLQFWTNAESYLLQHVHSGDGKSMLVPVLSIADITGPAINVHLTHSKYAATTKFNTDIVFALKYPGWPYEADEWITRERKSNWPSLSLRESVVKAGCEIVPTGHHASPRKDFEWKISFSHGEMLLSRSFTRIQRELVHTMKALISLQPSYRILNIMYREMEQINESEWVGKNFAQLLFRLIDTYIKCIERKELPHYFITERNLLEMYHYPTVDDHGTTVPTEEHLDSVLLELNEIRRDPLNKVLNQFKNVGLPEGLNSLIFQQFVDHIKVGTDLDKIVYVDTLVLLSIAHVNQGNIEPAYVYAQDALKLFEKLKNKVSSSQTFINLHLTVAVTSHLRGEVETALNSLIILEQFMEDGCTLCIGNESGGYLRFYYMLYGRLVAIKSQGYRIVLRDNNGSANLKKDDSKHANNADKGNTQNDDVNGKDVKREQSERSSTHGGEEEMTYVQRDKEENTNEQSDDKSRVDEQKKHLERAEKLYSLALNSLMRDNYDGSIYADAINFYFQTMNIDEVDKQITEFLSTSMSDFFLKRKEKIDDSKSSNTEKTSDLSSDSETQRKESMSFSDTTESKKPRFNNHEDVTVLYKRDPKERIDKESLRSAKDVVADGEFHPDSRLDQSCLIAKRYEALGMKDKADQIRNRVKQKLIQQFENGVELFDKMINRVNNKEADQFKVKPLIPEHWNNIFQTYMGNLVFSVGDIPFLDDILQSVVKKVNRIIKLPFSAALMHFLIQRYKVKGVIVHAKMMLEQLAGWEDSSKEVQLMVGFHFSHFGEIERANEAFQKANSIISSDLTVQEELLDRMDELIDIVSKFEIKNAVIDDIFS